MKKKDLIHQVAESEDVPPEEVEAVVDELLKLVQNRMEKGEETQIYGFGKFGVRWWKGRTGRDPQTGEEIEIEGRWIPYWSPSPTLIDESEPRPDAGQKVGGEASSAPEGKAEAAEREEEKIASAEEEVPDTPQDSDKEGEETAEVKHPAVSGDFEAGGAGKSGKADHEEAAEELPDTAPESRDTSKTEAAPAEPGPDQEMSREDVAAEKEEQEPAPSPPADKGARDKSEPFTESPDWPDIGDEISMKELRFISEQLKEEPGETSTGLFFFDEEDEAEESAESAEVGEPPSVSLTDEEQEREAPDEEPLEWAVTERRRGKFGWGVIITLSFALILFGAYLLLQERLPDLSTFIPDIQMNRETVAPDQSGSETEGILIEESGADLAREQPSDIPESSDQGTSVSTVQEPYNFVGVLRRETFLDVYNEALGQFDGENYRTAEVMFSRMLLSDPPGDYLDNLHYWLGECKYAQEQFEAAIREFELVFSAPNNNKVEDALIMMARSHIQLNQFDQAQTILRKFRTQYPNSQYTDLAMQWIRQYDL